MSLSEKCVQAILDTCITEKDRVNLCITLKHSRYTWAHFETYNFLKQNVKVTFKHCFTQWLSTVCHATHKHLRLSMKRHFDNEGITLHFHYILHNVQNDRQLSFYIQDDKVYKVDEANLPEDMPSAPLSRSTSVDEYMDNIAPRFEKQFGKLIKLLEE